MGMTQVLSFAEARVGPVSGLSMGLPVALNYTTDSYNGRVTRAFMALAASAVATVAVAAQTPQPFPRPGTAPAPAAQTPAQQPPGPAATQDSAAPTEAMLGVPIYPAAQFLASYDAGRAQRYYLFGSTASFAELVKYYRSVLKEGGDQVFTQPATHVFEVGRFREETMAFPPGVTIKDWTTGGSGGYPNPRPGAVPERFPTIVMIVPAPPGQPR
jgi:hypothetical protein